MPSPVIAAPLIESPVAVPAVLVGAGKSSRRASAGAAGARSS